MKTGRVLVVDDRENWRSQLGEMLREEGFEVETVESYAAAIQALQRTAFHLAVIDVRLIDAEAGNTDGLALISSIEENHWPTTVIIITGYGKRAHENNPLLKRPRVKDFLQKTELDTSQFLELVEHSIAHSIALSNGQR